MIKVLHIVGRMNMAGLETMLMNYYRFIDREEVEFNFLVLSGKHGAYDDEIISLGGKVIYPSVKYKWYNPIPFIKWFKDLITNEDYQIIHSHNGGASMVFKIAKKKGLKVIVHSHNTGNNKENMVKFYLRKLCKKISYRYVDSFLACSKDAGEFQFGTRKFTVLNNAIDLKKYIFNTDVRNRIRRDLGIKDEFVIGTVGRLEAVKNPDAILKIFQMFLENHPNSKFLWIGDGRLKDEIKIKIENMNLKNNVIMAGAVPNVSEMLQGIDVFILPSIYEGLGIVAIEAQAAGLNTLCSDAVSREAQVTDLCKFITLEDYSKWVNSLELVLKDNKCRDNKTELIKDKGYDISYEAKKLTEFYIQLIRGKSGEGKVEICR